jgi:organic radical activating enzyme
MKACSLKLAEKSFYLNQNIAGSCCKAYSDKFDRNLPKLIQRWQTEKLQMEQGIEVPSCEQCWADEAMGKQSLRQLSANLSPVEHKIDIYTSNLCNHMCSYCSPKFSSMWETSINTQGNFDLISSSAKTNLTPIIDQSQHAQENFKQIVDYINTQANRSIVLSLLGGEPLMQYHTLKNIFAINPQKVKRWVINTNLNPPSNRFLKQILEHASADRLLIHISLDATPEYNHIPRHGFDCARFKANLQMLRDNNIKHDFMSVCSVLGAFDLHNFIPWLIEQGQEYSLQALSNPSALQIRHLDPVYKTKILQQLDGIAIPDHLRWELETTITPRALSIQQYNYVRQYLKRSKITQLPGFAGVWWDNQTKLFSK